MRAIIRGFVLLGLLLVPPSAAARTYYVSPQGRDSNPGSSPLRPWRTLYRVDKAHLRPGDQVLFRGGGWFGDDALMPGWGTAVSGRPSRPIVFGSYGSGRARLPQGIWIHGEHDLIFQDLTLGPEQGVEGIGFGIVLQRCVMRNFLRNAGTPVNAVGAWWTIRRNLIERTGDSGVLVRGNHFFIASNTIEQTGLNESLDYGRHGVYLDAANSQVLDNTIVDFHDDGVSVRYRNSVVTGNVISGGGFGIAWFQYDRIPGHSVWSENTISGTSVAGIYVSPSDIGGATSEHFSILGNRLFRPARAASAHGGSWQALSLSHSRSGYQVRDNLVR